jgi:hypothetical protein
MPKLVIPELEALLNIPPRNKEWNDYEVAILNTYYGRVPISALAKQLNRSIDATKMKARSLGLTQRAKVNILQPDEG